MSDVSDDEWELYWAARNRRRYARCSFCQSVKELVTCNRCHRFVERCECQAPPKSA